MVAALWLALFCLLPGDQPVSLSFRTYRIVRQDLFIPLHWMLGELLSPLPSGPVEGDSVALVQRALARRADAERLEREVNRRYGATGAIDPALARATIEAEAEANELEPVTVGILAGQIGAELQEAGLSLAPRWLLPPVNFRFTSLPYVLVLSPRQRIQQVLTITLRGDLNLREIEEIEERVGQLGYSTLVVPIGGLGAYPSMLPRHSNVENILVTVAHEWAHHYFFFRPLGWRYGLGIENDSDVIAINETAADYVGQEVGKRAFARYYGGPPFEDGAAGTIPAAFTQSEDEFSLLMWETRQAVDTLLAAGQVDEAEQYMERQRFYLAERGYHLRKLNQAYFAFYSSYADRPGFASPIGEKMRRLRAASPALRVFVEQVGGMSSVADLDRAIEAIP